MRVSSARLLFFLMTLMIASGSESLLGNDEIAMQKERIEQQERMDEFNRNLWLAKEGARESGRYCCYGCLLTSLCCLYCCNESCQPSVVTVAGPDGRTRQVNTAIAAIAAITPKKIV